MEKFYLEDHLKKEGTPISEGMEFSALCNTIFQELMKECTRHKMIMEQVIILEEQLKTIMCSLQINAGE